MALDGLDAEAEELGDVRARLALGDEGEHLAFAVGQAVARLDLLGRGGAAALLEEDLGDRRAEEGLALGEGDDRRDEVAEPGALDQVAVGAGPDRRTDVLLGGVHGEDQHLRVLEALADEAGGVDAVELRHP